MPPNSHLPSYDGFKKEITEKGSKDDHHDDISSRFKNLVLSSIKPLCRYFIIIFLIFITEEQIPAPRHFMQAQWNKYISYLNHDPFSILVKGMSFSSTVIFWPVIIMFTYLDITGKPAFLKKYKVQPGKNEPVDMMKLLKTFIVVVFNFSLVSLPVVMLFYETLKCRGYDNSPNIPKFSWILCEFIVFIALNEITFYYTHRAMHHRFIYRYIHKLHHDWQAPIAMASAYAHPVDHIVCNMPPIFAGPLLMGSHPLTIIVWNVYVLYLSLCDHSGYHLPFLKSPEKHDYHHLKFTECFGGFGILDYLHGTDRKFRSSNNFIRDKVVYSFIPVNKDV